jgi:hypothetical protein
MNKFGHGVTTLLLFVLGLGCLSLVLHGLLDGVVDGANGATFPFASKPVKFTLIELFWLGLGLLLLLAAWRGLTRREVDVDDEREDEDEDATQPMRRTVAPALSPPTAPLPDARSATATTKPLPPESLELHTSRPYAVLVVIVSTLFAGSSVLTAIALTHILGDVFVAMLFAPFALLCLVTAMQCIRNFFLQGPVLVLNKWGITNYRKDGHLIPWTEVDAVRLDVKGSSTYLVLRFRRADDVLAHFGASRWLQSITGRLFYKGFEGRVKLTSLVFQRALVLKTVQAYLRYARR